jgi:hypothetical protein
VVIRIDCTVTKVNNGRLMASFRLQLKGGTTATWVMYMMTWKNCLGGRLWLLSDAWWGGYLACVEKWDHLLRIERFGSGSFSDCISEMIHISFSSDRWDRSILCLTPSSTIRCISSLYPKNWCILRLRLLGMVEDQKTRLAGIGQLVLDIRFPCQP